MKNKDAFGGCHPLVNFLYFGLVIGFSMFFMHPSCLFISLFSAVCYYISLRGKKAAAFIVRCALPVMTAAAVVNPAFNHQGRTVLCYLPTGNPLTLESILYGAAAAVMLVSVLIWFACYTEVMTSDKFVYLFGRIIPALSLVISMTLRFVPKFKAQFARVREAQTAVGHDMSEGSAVHRIRCAVTCFSAMVTWSLENAIETADSMKGRGWGLRGRSAFSIYTFTDRDKYLLLWLGFCGIYLLGGSLGGEIFWRWFPDIRAAALTPFGLSLHIIYFAMCITPVVLNGREERKWIKSLSASEI